MCYGVFGGGSLRCLLSLVKKEIKTELERECWGRDAGEDAGVVMMRRKMLGREMLAL